MRENHRLIGVRPSDSEQPCASGLGWCVEVTRDKSAVICTKIWAPYIYIWPNKENPCTPRVDYSSTGFITTWGTLYHESCHVHSGNTHCVMKVKKCFLAKQTGVSSSFNDLIWRISLIFIYHKKQNSSRFFSFKNHQMPNDMDWCKQAVQGWKLKPESHKHITPSLGFESSQGSMPACQQPLAPLVPVTPWCRTPPKPNLRVDPLETSKRSDRAFELRASEVKILLRLTNGEKAQQERQRHVPKESRSQPSGRMSRQGACTVSTKYAGLSAHSAALTLYKHQ